jgi:hypothetical protein
MRNSPSGRHANLPGLKIPHMRDTVGVAEHAAAESKILMVTRLDTMHSRAPPRPKACFRGVRPSTSDATWRSGDAVVSGVT